jgi:hypothetical protein
MRTQLGDMFMGANLAQTMPAGTTAVDVELGAQLGGARGPGGS